MCNKLIGIRHRCGHTKPQPTSNTSGVDIIYTCALVASTHANPYQCLQYEPRYYSPDPNRCRACLQADWMDPLTQERSQSSLAGHTSAEEQQQRTQADNREIERRQVERRQVERREVERRGFGEREEVGQTGVQAMREEARAMVRATARFPPAGEMEGRREPESRDREAERRW